MQFGSLQIVLRQAAWLIKALGSKVNQSGSYRSLKTNDQFLLMLLMEEGGLGALDRRAFAIEYRSQIITAIQVRSNQLLGFRR